jgi:hypothetical protein
MSPSPRRLSLSLGLLISGALLLPALSARSQSAPGSATATAEALPEIRGADIPAEPSEVPKTPEWAAAKNVRPHRDDKMPCVFSVLRDWLRVECRDRIGAALVAGDPADVKIWAWGDPFASRSESGKRPDPPTTVMTMRLQRGMNKVFQLIRFDAGYEWPSPEASERIAVVWREGRPDPVLLIELPIGWWW